MKRLLLFTLIALIISGCQSNKSEPASITVAAAASLSDAMKELNSVYEKEHPGTDITLNLASSGVLANQIKQGAPIDVFLSASESHFQSVKQQDLLEPDHQIPLLKNQLVLIKSRSSTITNLEKLGSQEVNRIAIGTPETVPAGAYAKEALQFVNLWNRLEENLIFGKDVRQVLTYVETGNADAGIVYETDYRTSNKVELVEKIPEEAYSPIIYPAGVIRGASEEAVAYYTFLQSKEAKAIFESYGFQSDVSDDD
ncbi:molybdate ABC transporter substrate-binding protein [Pseudalkalibacillus hwajinpoensis]|uniref:molybdate ABC transporter substrate-binding protein n=1 Tax=Guptibacillus hwajinpoensis TaxID=208199 RepID=UPI001CFE9C5D|nr:molybdate ABC transporter substrate-binding protein [Pseudalkalibacillus hwajinpoensis]